ncbi:GGDEF domain-containing protein [uncultured Croceicoccus sp.]|uniref:GGDEF domain-containing protein n=1 Tax=uncultured Croceicoccus sp. TaxID=1295329 RepID=UPI00262E4058|nr:GGDEF domain-containing protein [uncultured Croceicoccus sp.]
MTPAAVVGEAAAHCIGSDDPVIIRLERETGRDPKAAVDMIARQIARTDREDRNRLALLYLAKFKATYMSGGDALPLLEKARQAASGFPPDHVANLTIRLADVPLMDDNAAKLRALAAITRDYGSLPEGSMARTCRGLNLAFEYAMRNRPREAFILATQAYRNSEAHKDTIARASAASFLAYLVSTGRDFAYARELQTEALAIFLKLGQADLASNELVLRGYAQLADDEWKGALDDFDAAADLSRRYDNSYAVHYAELGSCMAALDGEAFETAAPACESAYAGFAPEGGPKAFAAAASLAGLRVAQGDPREAIALLDPLLAGERGENQIEDWMVAFRTRADALASVDRYAEAYADLQKVTELSEAYVETELESGTTALRARFKTRELEDSLAEEQRRSEARLRLVTVVVLGAIVTFSLLGILVFVLARHRRQFRRLAMTDPLTGLANRRATLRKAEDVFHNNEAGHADASFALLDIDHFKSCNDEFGHDAGDRVLSTFASIIESCVRPGDAVGRWGGEEFLLIAPDASGKELVRMIERVRHEAEAEYFDYAPGFRLRFSAGIAELSEAGGEPDACIKLADRRLYYAKARGRNQSCAEGDGMFGKEAAAERSLPHAVGRAAGLSA